MPPVRLFANFAMCLISLISLSCGDKRFKPVYSVRGSVFYEGKPAAGASIRFLPQGVPDHPWTRPSAEVDDKGEFVVTTYRENDGMPAGKYGLSIVWLPKGYAGPIEKVNKLPARYADPATSGLVIDIEPKDTVLPAFNLTK